jgi:hypothetical protein
MFCRLRKCALSRIYQNIDSDSLGILFISFFVQCAEGVAGYILGGKSLHNCLYLTVHEMMINLEPTLQCCIQCAASCVWGGPLSLSLSHVIYYPRIPEESCQCHVSNHESRGTVKNCERFQI